MRTIFSQKSGHTLMEAMIALMISSILFLTIYQIVQLMSNLNFFDQSIQDINGILQLKQTLNLGSNVEISSDTIEFDFKEEHFTISMINNRLIIQPGTNILILDIDWIEFIEDDNGLVLIFQRDGREYQRRIYG